MYDITIAYTTIGKLLGFIKYPAIYQEMHFCYLKRFYDQLILKFEQPNGRNPPTHPNPNIVQILKSVEKNGCSLMLPSVLHILFIMVRICGSF